MMKLVIYLLVFVIILFVAGFGFFTMTMPNVPVQMVTRNLDPKDAFAGSSLAGNNAPSQSPSGTAPAVLLPASATGQE